jgi:3-oxoacyl-[acyl-carrier protein] reductase
VDTDSNTPIAARRVFVTGASRGLGLALTEALLVDGWQVVGTARKQSPALEALAVRFPGRFEFHSANLADPASVTQLVTDARLLDGYDAFISNAGIGMDGLVTLLSSDAIEEGVQVNLVTPMLLARAVLKGMLTRGGSLLFIASIAARTGFSGLAAYGATKAGLVGFSRGLAREYGSRNIRSNCILPGFLATDMTASLDAPRQSQLQRRTPLGRLGDPSDVVGSVRFLLSDAARHITGTEVTIDGGMTA